MNYRIKYTDIAAAVPNYTMDGAYLTVEKDRYPKGGGEMTVETVSLEPDLVSDDKRVVSHYVSFDNPMNPSSFDQI